MIGPMLRRLAACAAAIAIAAAAVADNPAICDDDRPVAGSHESPGSCAGMPCQTPGEAAVQVVSEPAVATEGAVVLWEVELVSADALPPPTPPPTLAV